MVVIRGGELDLSTIETTNKIGVTRYSRFLLHCLRDTQLKDLIACDFGSGSGVIGVALAELGASHVTFVEPHSDARSLTERNVSANLADALSSNVVCGVDQIPASLLGQFDLLVSNPSSLPTLSHRTDDGAFFDGGEHGLDMIQDMIDACRLLLKQGGKLNFLLTSLSDYKSVLRNLSLDFVRVEVRSVVQFDFRPHYGQHEEYWEALREEGRAFFFSNGTGRVELVFFVEAER